MLCLLIGLRANVVRAQDYVIGDTTVFSLSEGESAHIPLLNNSPNDLPIAVELLHGDLAHFHLSVDSTEASLYLDSMIFLYGKGKATLNCRYFPKSERPDTAYIYIHSRFSSQADTIMVFSTDTTGGVPDSNRTKKYLFPTIDTIRLNSLHPSLNVLIANYSHSDVIGYSYVASGSHQFTVSDRLLVSSPTFDYSPGSMTIGYNDLLGYGHFDTAKIVLYPYLPADARPDTLVALYEHDIASVDIAMPDLRSVPASVNTCKNAYITNPHDTPVHIVSLTAVSDANRLSISTGPSVPFDLAPHSTVPVMLCFVAPSVGKIRFKASLVAGLDPFDHLNPSTSTGTTDAWIDDGCVTVAPDTLRFRWVKPFATITDTVRITDRLSVSLRTSQPTFDSTSGDTSLFSITSPTTAFVLNPGSSHLLYFRFRAPAEVGEYPILFEYEFAPDQVVDPNCLVRRIWLVGRVSLSDSLDVDSQAAPSLTEVTISPNPTSGATTIRLLGGRATVAEVYDELGSRITLLSAGTQWQWRAEQNSARAGVYYLRLQGFANNGRPFVRTERIVVN